MVRSNLKFYARSLERGNTTKRVIDFDIYIVRTWVFPHVSHTLVRYIFIWLRTAPHSPQTKGQSLISALLRRLIAYLGVVVS